jgi:peptidoglycan/xylan/chitin deacetylase (PgdA/CDA1 family)
VIAAAALLAGCGGGGTTTGHTATTPPKQKENGARPGAAQTQQKRQPAAQLPRRYGPPGHEPVPVLMYHVVTAPKPGTPYPGLWTPEPVFAAQMRALKRAGFHAVTLQDAVDSWTKGLILPRKPIVISFDDGYSSQYRNAARILRRLGWPGVLFLETKNLHVAGGLTVREVKQMIAAGWELGSHTVTHPDLTTLDASALRQELVQSRAILRRTFGVPVLSFCYPAGRFDGRVLAATRAAGYQQATTTQPGIAQPSTDRLTLPRIRVDGQTSPATLVAEAGGTAAAAGGYGG